MIIGRLIRVLLVVGIVLLFVYSTLGLVFTGPVVVRQPQPLISKFDIAPSPERLRRDVEHLSVDLSPRDFRHTDHLDAAAAWIAGEFRRAGLEVTYQDYQLREGRYRNVIARRDGVDPNRGARVIGAHYDAVSGSPGADDDASGVAVLLELARTLPDAPSATTSYLVAFSTEEPPFFGSEDMGSYVFATSLLRQGVDVELMVALDSVGYFDPSRGSQNVPSGLLRLYYPSHGSFVAVAGDLHSGAALREVKIGLRTNRDLEVRSFRGPVGTGVLLSDHASFRRLGLPGVLVTDTGYLRDPDYHTAGDTADRLDYDTMAAIVYGLNAVLWNQPPTKVD